MVGDMIREKVMVGDMIRGVIRATEIDGVVICALTYETSVHTRAGGLYLTRTKSIIVISLLRCAVHHTGRREK